MILNVCNQNGVFILEHYFASELFAAVHEAFSTACPVTIGMSSSLITIVTLT
jgi:hypothetical protein